MLNDKKIIFVMFLLALAMRLYYVIALPQLSLAGSDAKEYDLIAEDLLKGKGFPVERLSGNEVEIVRPPLYPLFLKSIYAVFGHSYTAVRIIQAILASILVFFIYYMAKDIFRNRKLAIISCLLYSLYPSLIAYTGLLYTEALFTFFLFLAIYFLNRCISSKERKFCILTGLFLGIATMISSRSLYMSFFILIGLLFTIKEKTSAIKKFLYVILVMLFIFLPWTIRNYFVTGGKFILLENYSSSTGLWLATNPQGKIEWNYDEEPLKSLVGHLPPQEKNLVIRREAIKNLKQYPLAYLRNSAKRLFITLIGGHSNCFAGLEKSTYQSIEDAEIVKAVVKILLLLFNVLVIFLGFIGIYLFRKNWRTAIPILIPIVYIVLIHALYVAGPRGQIPMMPFLIIFSSFTIIKIMDKTLNKTKEVR